MFRKKLSKEDLINDGYLLEANRQFFHPLGLSLYIDNNGNIGIFDDREYPEGSIFAVPDHIHHDVLKKYERFREILKKRKKDRRKVYGLWVQGIGLTSASGAIRIENGEFL